MKSRHYIYVFATILFMVFLFTIIRFATHNRSKEGFLPGLNILFNEQKRNLRLMKETFVDGSKEHIDRFLRKSGLN